MSDFRFDNTKFNKSEVLIFCPVFNEAHHLEGLINELKNTYFFGDFLFINSGSTDESLEILKKSNFNFISLKKNQGIGNVIMEAIRYGNNNNYSILCLLAGNSKMRPKYINRVLDPILNDDYDFVQGSRYIENVNTNNMPIFRKIVIPLTSKIFSFIYQKKITDATCGFRAFKLSLVNSASYNIYANWLKKYAFEPYLYSNVLLDKDVRSKEVAITMDYPKKELKLKYTKIKPILDYPSLFFPYLIAYLNPKKFNR